jgi:hypothetical protein
MDDIDELMRLRRLRTNLERPAYLFERFGGECKGDCPVPIEIAAALYPEGITCCNLFAVWEVWSQTRALERALTAKVQQAKEAA